jgi:hypothetical protein
MKKTVEIYRLKLICFSLQKMLNLLFKNPDLASQEPVLRIHDILGWLRIRILGSMPLTNGSGSCYIRH